MKLHENETNGDSLWENSYYEDVLKPCAVKKEKKYKPHKHSKQKREIMSDCLELGTWRKYEKNGLRRSSLLTKHFYVSK